MAKGEKSERGMAEKAGFENLAKRKKRHALLCRKGSKKENISVSTSIWNERRREGKGREGKLDAVVWRENDNGM